MDLIKVLTGASILLVAVGLSLVGLSHGGLFNRVIPVTHQIPNVYTCMSDDDNTTLFTANMVLVEPWRLKEPRV
jgi:hypothetical protein